MCYFFSAQYSVGVVACPTAHKGLDYFRHCMQATMKTGSYVYILCSSGRDLFPEMTAVSLATLRMASPHARIVVLVDRQTSLLHTPGLTSLREAADEFKVVDCPDTSPILRSRFLKCGARHICLLYTSPSPRDRQKSRMPSSA